MGTKSLEDKMFQALKDIEKPTPPITRAPRPQLMSVMSLRLIDAREDHHYQPDQNRNVARNLTREVRKSLAVDTRRREEVASEEIESLLENTQGTTSYIQGAYFIFKWCYRHTSGNNPHPPRKDFKKVLGDYAALYQQEDTTPTGRPVLTHFNPFNINYENTIEGDIKAAIKCMRRNRAGGDTHLWTEHL